MLYGWLRGQLEEANMSDGDIAERQLGVLESMNELKNNYLDLHQNYKQ